MPTAHLGWTANPEPEVNNYKLYVGTASGVYNAPGSPQTMGNVTDGFFTLPGDGTYYFALTSVNTSLREGPFSSEVVGVFTSVATLPIRGFAG